MKVFLLIWLLFSCGSRDLPKESSGSQNRSSIVSGGVYRITSGDQLGGKCSQRIRPYYSGTEIVKIEVKSFGTCKWQFRIPCDRGKCDSNKFSLQKLRGKSYVFIQKKLGTKSQFEMLSDFSGSFSKTFIYNEVQFRFSKISRSVTKSLCKPPTLGCFLMGSPTAEVGRFWSIETLHEVVLSKDYYFQTTELTRDQYKAVMDKNPEDGIGYKCNPLAKKSNYPASCVSWLGAKEFVSKLNSTLDTTMFHLPTEAEWEFAARCGSSAPYGRKGIEWHQLKDAKIAWYERNSQLKVQRVGLLKPNACGLYDTLGNVWEWVEDNFYFYPQKRVVDPLVTTGTKNKVYRGGGFEDSYKYVRAAMRGHGGPDYGISDIGFRLVQAKR